MRDDGRIWEYGGRWIGKVDGSSFFYEFWYDPGRRRVLRRSLRTDAVELAKRRLVESVATKPRQAGEPEDVAMSVVLTSYLTHHLAGRPSQREARRSFERIEEFMAKRSRRNAAYRVSEFDLIAQRDFVASQRGSGRSTKTVLADLVQCAAAVSWASKDQIVIDGASHRQIRILSRPTAFLTSPAAVAEILDAPAPGRREWIPSPAELSGFIDRARPHEMVFRFCVIALNTWARRQAVFEFRRSMIDRQMGLVDMNPDGRRQTKKRRPLIRLTENLRHHVDAWGVEEPIVSPTLQFSDITERFRSLAAECKLPRLTPHVLRHYCATRARSLGAPRPEVEEWLGHTKQRTTDIYLHMDPDWLTAARDATDKLVKEVGL